MQQPPFEDDEQQEREADEYEAMQRLRPRRAAPEFEGVHSASL